MNLRGLTPKQKTEFLHLAAIIESNTSNWAAKVANRRWKNLEYEVGRKISQTEVMEYATLGY